MMLLTRAVPWKGAKVDVASGRDHGLSVLRLEIFSAQPRIVHHGPEEAFAEGTSGMHGHGHTPAVTMNHDYVAT